MFYIPGHIYLFRLREMGPTEKGGFHIRIQVPGRQRPELRLQTTDSFSSRPHHVLKSCPPCITYYDIGDAGAYKHTYTCRVTFSAPRAHAFYNWTWLILDGNIIQCVKFSSADPYYEHVFVKYELVTTYLRFSSVACVLVVNSWTGDWRNTRT